MRNRNRKRSACITFLACLFISLSGSLSAVQAQDLRPVDVQTLKAWMDESQESLVVVDLRSLLACLDAKIPQAVCFPCGTQKAFPGNALPQEAKIIVYEETQPAAPGRCPVIQAILETGRGNVYRLDGGLPAWRKEGYPVISEKRTPRVPAPAVKAADLDSWRKQVANPLILDVREASDFAAGHIDGAMNIPLSVLHVDYGRIPLDASLLIADADGTQSFLAASFLARKGFPRVLRLKGGMAEYQRRKP